MCSRIAVLGKMSMHQQVKNGGDAIAAANAAATAIGRATAEAYASAAAKTTVQGTRLTFHHCMLWLLWLSATGWQVAMQTCAAVRDK